MDYIRNERYLSKDEHQVLNKDNPKLKNENFREEMWKDLANTLGIFAKRNDLSFRDLGSLSEVIVKMLKQQFPPIMQEYIKGRLDLEKLD